MHAVAHVFLYFRFVGNSVGFATDNKPSVEIIHGNSYTNYADGQYHQINVEIGEYTKVYTYTFGEGTSNTTMALSTAKDLHYDLDEAAYYLGMPKNEKLHAKGILLSTRNFEGCLNYLLFNEKEINLTKSSLQNTKALTFSGKFLNKCSIQDPLFLKSFILHSDQLKIPFLNQGKGFRIKFSYRTYQRNGIIFKSIGHKKVFVILDLKRNKLNLRVNFTNFTVFLSHYDSDADDGIWREIFIDIFVNEVLFTIDRTKYNYRYKEKEEPNFADQIIFGGPYENKIGFIGCVKNIYVGKNLKSVNDILNLNQRFTERQCRMKDLCFPNNPCRNNGKCFQSKGEVSCNCTSTGYKGKLCEIKRKYNFLKSCGEYYTAGYHYDGYYIIKPGLSPPFKVKCEMNTSRPKTIIESNMSNKTFVFTGKDYDSEYYYYHISYRAKKQQIVDLIKISGSCQQYVQYNCYESVLLNSKSMAHLTELGLRWYTREGHIRNTWDGKGNNPTCKCGHENNCTQSNLLCNCDIMDKILRRDNGYLTDRNDLPISKIRVSILHTNERSSFEVGPLECQSELYSGIKQPDIPVTESHHTWKGQNIVTSSHYNTTRLVNEVEKKEFVVIDRKLLYIIIAGIVLLIIILILLFIFKRYLCCIRYRNKPKPQIVEFYKDELTIHPNRTSENNNKENQHNLDEELNDIRVLNRRSASNSSSSVSTIDPNRYYSQDYEYDQFSLQSNKSNISCPKSILKIKKDSVPLTRQQQILIDRHQKELQYLSNQKEQQMYLSKHRQYLQQQSWIQQLQQNETDENKPTGVREYTKKSVHNNQHHYKSGKKKEDKEKQTFIELDLANLNHEVENNGSENRPLLSPLKKKVLDLSTSKGTDTVETQKNKITEYKTKTSRNSQIVSSSSSRTSSNDSELNFSDEVLPLRSELKPLQRSKSVRFSNEEENKIICTTYSKKLKSKSLPPGNEESLHFLYEHDFDKTLFV